MQLLIIGKWNLGYRCEYLVIGAFVPKAKKDSSLNTLRGAYSPKTQVPN